VLRVEDLAHDSSGLKLREAGHTSGKQANSERAEPRQPFLHVRFCGRGPLVCTGLDLSSNVFTAGKTVAIFHAEPPKFISVV
jgi:hypothetical protein